MTEASEIDTTIEQPKQALVVRNVQPVVQSGLFGTNDPAAVMEKAGQIATVLKGVLRQQKLISTISGKEYPKCEAWTLLGTMLGVFPVLVWTRQLPNGWEARVEARTKGGEVIGAAEAECLRTERNWSSRDDFALRSMAQTRATAKCLRMPLGFVMTLADLEPTPAEEMVSDHPQKPTQKAEPRQAETKPKAQETVKLRPPTAATRMWMIDQISKADLHKIAVEYFHKLDSPSVLMENEGLSEVPLWSVPNCHQEMLALISKIKEFGNGDRAGHAFAPHYDAEDAHPPKLAAESLPKSCPKDPEWWRDVIVPVPPKGSKRAEYMVNPDTLGSLFDLRHGNDEESQAARQRLWGFVNHYEAKPWIGNDGKQRPPSDTDVKFREALDALADWFEKNHRGEKL